MSLVYCVRCMVSNCVLISSRNACIPCTTSCRCFSYSGLRRTRRAASVCPCRRSVKVCLSRSAVLQASHTNTNTRQPPIPKSSCIGGQPCLLPLLSSVVETAECIATVPIQGFHLQGVVMQQWPRSHV